MADSRANRPPLMDVRVIAIYASHIPAFAGRSGVRFRRRKKQQSTVVPCQIKAIDGRTVGVPAYPVPEGTPRPRFRAQIEIVRTAVDQRRVVHVLLSAEPTTPNMDPEQLLLSPIFDDGRRMIFEFQRAQVFSVNAHGHVETRLVAVHPVLGIIGTKTTSRFNIRMSALATRCFDYLAGAVELFPAQERAQRVPRIPIPEGEANLSFECAGRRRQDDAEERGPTAELSTADPQGLEAGSLILTEHPNAFDAPGNGSRDAPTK
jgi:hypothetical protein